MLRSRLAALLPVVVLALALPDAAVSATVRYAGPGASDAGACSSSDPCSIFTAVSGAATGDEVVVLPGTHAAPRALAVPSVAQGVWIHGVPGQSRPVIDSTATDYGHAVLLRGSAVLEHVDVRTAGTGSAIETSGSALVQNVAVAASSLAAPAPASAALRLLGSAVLRNVAVLSTRPGERGIWYSDCASGNEVRHATARLTGAGATGLYIQCTSGSVTVRDSAFVAAGTDISLIGSTAGVSVSVDHSSYATLSGTATDAGGNQTALPLFVGEGWHQEAGSPTSDAGHPTLPFALAFDLDGEPRTFGVGPDIGADERVPAPALTTDPVTDVTTGAATLHGTVATRAVGVTYAFEYGPTPAYGVRTPWRALPAGTGVPVAVSEPLAGLPAGTTQHVRMTADGPTGIVVGPDRSFTTLAPPITPPVIPPADPGPPPGTAMPADTRAPQGRIGVAAGQRLGRVAGRGLRLSVSADEAATATLVLRAAGVSSARRVLPLTAGRTRSLTVLPGRRLAARLRALRRARVTVTLTLRDGAGNTRTVSRAVLLRR